MKKAIIPTTLSLLIAITMHACTQAESYPSSNSTDVTIVHREDKKRVDVFMDGSLFTSYLFSEEGNSLKKPILYPIRTATGKEITRGYPYEKRAGERVDHPHHVGHWLNYGDVNGFDFWNHHDGQSAERKKRMGSIIHRGVTAIEDSEKRGILEVEADWITPDGTVLLKENTEFVFKKSENKRMIDRRTTLTAVSDVVKMTDNKEGMFALRVTRALEHPTDDLVLLTDEEGMPREEKVVDNMGVSGQYLSSEGASGTAVWGTRAEWMILSGIVQDENVSIAIIDHPNNPGYPTYWHARGYGLFSANPLGQNIFSDGAEELNYTLNKGENVTFRYRMVILSNAPEPVVTISSLSKSFAKGSQAGK